MTTIFEQFSDKELIDKINDEPAMFEILIRRNNAALYKTGRSYGYNHEDTQDLMQETFVSAYISLGKFENRSSLRTWLVRIMLNNCFQRRQKFSYKNEISDEIHENSIPMFENQQDTNGKILNRELGTVVEKALITLPLDYRMVFSLREMNGLSVAETAESLNISDSNVKVRLNRAKAMLRQEIEKWYTAEEIFEFNLIYCDAMVNRVMTVIKQINK
ncbi:MAG: sigma-70 family polymerase sigma factor [Sphingobacteriaceae bacterium]|jgi:RNA polymerase sigma-70 factor (ECF subfamily)|nr:sigma-70 family polymerase sigma factor [Sphingobacteriaceae bacterium]